MTCSVPCNDLLSLMKYKGRKMKEFRSAEYESIELEESTDVVFGSLYTSGISILSLFIARGNGTGHCYQPNINYRNLDISYLNCSHTDPVTQKVTRPMVSSHVDSGLGDDFSLLAPISLLPYEVCKSMPGMKLSTHCCLNIPDENGCSTLGNGNMGLANAVFPSAQCFAETLAFFGFEWIDISGKKVENIDESTPNPTLKDLIGFVKLFDSQSLQTAADFKLFLNEYDLEAFYEFDSTISVVDNVWKFGQLMRECISLRLGVFDGQHRMVLMTLFVSGFFEISNCQFLDRTKTFATVFPDNTWANAQVWCNMKVRIGFAGIPKKADEIGELEIDPDFERGASILRKFGDAVRRGQTHHIPVTWSFFFNEFSKIMRNTVVNENDFPRFNFHNHWAENSNTNKGDANLKRRLEVLWNALVEFLAQDDQYGNLLAGSVTGGIKKCLDTCRPPFKGEKGAGGDFRILNKSSGVSLPFQHLLNCVKLFAFEKDLFNSFLTLTEAPNPSKKQRSTLVKHYHPYLSDMWWCQHYIFGPLHSLVTKDLRIKLLVERRIIEYLRKSDGKNGDEAIRDMLESGDFSKSASMRAAISTGPEKITEKSLGMDRTACAYLYDKILYSAYQALLLDVLQCISKYGYDPDLSKHKMDVKKNSHYTYYLQ